MDRDITCRKAGKWLDMIRRLVGRTTSHHALYDGAVCVVCGMRACGSLVGCTTSHHALYDGAAASLVVPRAIIRRTMMRQPRWLYHEPPCVVRWCGVYVFGHSSYDDAAASLVVPRATMRCTMVRGLRVRSGCAAGGGRSVGVTVDPFCRVDTA